MKIQPECEWDPLLGKVPDTEIAERFGVHFNTVYRRRKKLGVPALLRRAEAPYRGWVGRIPDATIARCWGVKEKSVADTRRRMKLAEVEHLRAEVCAAVAEERAAVVAWLRDNEDTWQMPAWKLADAIERGDHRREETHE